MFLPVVAGPSAKFLLLIKQTYYFFIGRFYKSSIYQHCKGMKNACFFFSYNNLLEGSERSIVRAHICQSSGKQLVQVFFIILSHSPFALDRIPQGWTGSALSPGHLQTLCFFKGDYKYQTLASSLSFITSQQVLRSPLANKRNQLVRYVPTHFITTCFSLLENLDEVQS